MPVEQKKLFSSIPNEFEPLRKDMWSLEFPVEMNIPYTFEITCDRPTVTNNEIEVPYKQLTFYYKGKTKVEPITVSFRDVIGPHVYQKLFQWQKQHTDFGTGAGGYAQQYKKTLTLNMEDPAGVVMQKYILYGCFLTNLSGGSLDMNDDGVAEVSTTIRFDTFDLI